jgi:hypothetical protein
MAIPSPSITAPAANATWALGAPVDIGWEWSDGAEAKVNLQLVNGIKVTPIASNLTSPGGAGTYRWTPPLTLTPATGYRVKVVAATTAAVADLGTSSIELARPTLTLNSPASATVGVPVDLTWQWSDTVQANVTLQLVRPGRVTVLAANLKSASDGSGTYRWTPAAALIPASDYTLRAVASASTAVTSTPAALDLSRPTISLTAPSTLTTGVVAAISWQYSGAATLPVRVDLLRGTTVAASATTNGATVSGAGSVNWTVARTLTAGSYSLRIRPVALASSDAVQDVLAVTVVRP